MLHSPQQLQATKLLTGLANVILRLLVQSLQQGALTRKPIAQRNGQRVARFGYLCLQLADSHRVICFDLYNLFAAGENAGVILEHADIKLSRRHLDLRRTEGQSQHPSPEKLKTHISAGKVTASGGSRVKGSNFCQRRNIRVK